MLTPQDKRRLTQAENAVSALSLYVKNMNPDPVILNALDKIQKLIQVAGN